MGEAKNVDGHFLHCAAFRFSLEVTTLTVLPPYKGGVFRAAFGNAFRKVVCPGHRAVCTKCIVREQCLYVAFFEPPPPRGYPDSAKFNQAPAPYVLNPPLTNRQVFHPGDRLEFEMVLMGRAIDALPYFAYTFMELGDRGLGAEHGKYRLLKIDGICGGKSVTVYDDQTQCLRPSSEVTEAMSYSGDDPIGNLTLRFLTPLRFKENGRLVTHFSFPLFFERLAHRITLLSAFYGNGNGLPDFSSLQDRAHLVQISSNALYWYDWERYSRRQDALMKFGGLRGEIGLSGNLGPFMPALRFGEITNVGQGTSFGLGRYQIG